MTNVLMNMFSASTMASAPSVQMGTPTAGPPPFVKATKFNDLPDALKKTFEDIEYVFQLSFQDSHETHAVPAHLGLIFRDVYRSAMN